MKKIIFALALVASSSVFANVKGGKIGVDFSLSGSTVIGTTPTVGVWWHVIDMVAIRPSVGYTNTTTTNSTTNSETSVSGLVFGIGVPIYLAKLNLLDLYVSPAFSYSSNTTKTTVAGTSVSGTSSGIGVSLSLGLQVALNDQLHFFGEMGGGYSSTTNDPTKTTTIGTTRGAAGVIFYFN